MSLRTVHLRLEQLRKQMQDAAEAMDFETAARLRNEIAELTSGTPAEHEIEPDTSVGQPPPGAMGLGTHIPVAEPPKGWKRPKKPDPLTTNVSRGKRR